MRLAAQHADWPLGGLDETWGSRLAQPALPRGTAGKPLRLIAQPLPQGDGDPKALAGDGRLRTDTHQVWLRLVAGRPVSHMTTAWLAWLCERLAGERKRVLVLIWDQASWQRRQEARHWRRAHHRQAKPAGAIRLLVCPFPVKSPGLKPLAPRWVPSKRAIVEPARLLTAAELISRVCDYGEGEPREPRTQKVA